MQKFLPSFVLFIVSIYHLYDQFASDRFSLSDFDRDVYNNSYIAVFFLILGLWGIKYSSNRIYQWVTVIMALLLAGGGFLGFGWIVAILLGVIYIALAKIYQN